MISRKEESDYCVICSRKKDHTHHLLYGRGIRELADKDELTIPLCAMCHSQIHESGMAGHLSKILGQLEYENRYIINNYVNAELVDYAQEKARTEFRKRYGRSYI